jgi:hypothetical protein
MNSGKIVRGSRVTGDRLEKQSRSRQVSSSVSKETPQRKPSGVSQRAPSPSFSFKRLFWGGTSPAKSPSPRVRSRHFSPSVGRSAPRSRVRSTQDRKGRLLTHDDLGDPRISENLDSRSEHRSSVSLIEVTMPSEGKDAPVRRNEKEPQDPSRKGLSTELVTKTSSNPSPENRTLLRTGISPHSRRDRTPALLVPSRKVVPNLDEVHLHWYDEYDLKKLYPPSNWLIVSDSLPWIGIASVVTFLGAILQGPVALISPESINEAVVSWLVRVSLLGCIFSVFFFYLSLASSGFRISGFRLVVSKGVLWKKKASMAIAGVAQFYVKQLPREALFNLYRVEMFLPMTPDNSLTVFRGLSKKQAHHFEAFMSREMNRQMFVSGDAIKLEQEARVEAEASYPS